MTPSQKDHGLEVVALKLTKRQRFERLYIPEPNSGCWLWLGTVARERRPYGRFWNGRKQAPAHRESFEMHKGEIPAGMCVLHICDNPACVNPDHLRIGTAAENVEDRQRKGRQARGERQWNSKLTTEEVMGIRSAPPEQRKEIMATFGIGMSTFYHIRSGHTWGHLSEKQE